jgi:membrane-associated phospholipid phosphatase
MSYICFDENISSRKPNISIFIIKFLSHPKPLNKLSIVFVISKKNLNNQFMKKGLIVILIIFYFQNVLAQQNKTVDSTKMDALNVQLNLHDTSTLSSGTVDSASITKTVVNQQQNQQITSTGLHSKFKNTAVNSPYHTSFVKDGLVITAAAGVTLLGYNLIKNKKDLTSEELATKTRSSLPFFDRGNAGYYSKQVDQDSYILFDGSYAIPVLGALLNKRERSKFGQVMVMYLETIAITGSLYTITAGLVYRSRPFVYGDKAPLEKRLDKGAHRSFYGGHVATTAAATFFTAKVFQDFNPDSKLTPYLYTGAGALTVLMGYMRYKAGYHFLSDCVLSGIIGTATGILIPQFHKNKSLKNISLTPYYQEGAKGLSLVYRL